MSEAKKCDICGEFFELPEYVLCYGGGPLWSHIQFRNDTEGDYDLCRNCTIDLLEWVNSMKAACKEENND